MNNNNDTIIVYGATWCPDCTRAKQFFGEHRVQYRWVDIEQDSEAMTYVEEVNRGMRSIPTIVFPDGSILVEPSNAQLADKLGLQRHAQRRFYDVIIVGGGPTGLTAALYSAREGIDTLVIEKSALGGQVGITQTLDNYPGFDEGISGAEFARRLGNQARRFGVEILQAQAVKSIFKDGRYGCVTTSDGTGYAARAVLVATGSKYRKLDVPGEDALIGIHIHFCATCDGAFYKGKEVIVVGTGNSGFEEGLFLTKFVKQVTIIGNAPEIKASKILQERVAERSDMRVVTNHAIKEFQVKDRKLAGVVVENRTTGASRWRVCLHWACAERRVLARRNHAREDGIYRLGPDLDDVHVWCLCRRRRARGFDQASRERGRRRRDRGVDDARVFEKLAVRSK